MVHRWRGTDTVTRTTKTVCPPTEKHQKQSQLLQTAPYDHHYTMQSSPNYVTQDTMSIYKMWTMPDNTQRKERADQRHEKVRVNKPNKLIMNSNRKRNKRLQLPAKWSQTRIRYLHVYVIVWKKFKFISMIKITVRLEECKSRQKLKS